MIVEIIHDAKCKHCRFFNYTKIMKKDGTKSKINRAFCTNPISERFTQQLTLKTLACKNIKL